MFYLDAVGDHDYPCDICSSNERFQSGLLRRTTIDDGCCPSRTWIFTKQKKQTWTNENVTAGDSIRFRVHTVTWRIELFSAILPCESPARGRHPPGPINYSFPSKGPVPFLHQVYCVSLKGITIFSGKWDRCTCRISLIAITFFMAPASIKNLDGRNRKHNWIHCIESTAEVLSRERQTQETVGRCAQTKLSFSSKFFLRLDDVPRPHNSGRNKRSFSLRRKMEAKAVVEGEEEEDAISKHK